MKNAIIVGCTVASALLILSTVNLTPLLLFLLAGVVPGTDISLSAGTMLTLIALAVSVVILLSLGLRIAHFSSIHRLAKQYRAAKQQLPRRRFSQI